MWLLGGGGGDSAYKTTIEEANKHLNALSKRIEELEAALEEQKAEMERREVIYTESVKELHELRDQETAALSAKVKEYGSTIRCLESDLRRRDTELNILRQRCRILDEILRYKASLAKLTITLEQAEQYSKSVYRTTQDQRLAGASEVMVHVDPTPRPTKSIEYLVDDVPDDEIVDRVGEAYVISCLICDVRQSSRRQPPIRPNMEMRTEAEVCLTDMQRFVYLCTLALDNNATVKTRWCQRRNVIHSTTLEVFGRTRRQHKDWFDDNAADISNLLAVKNRQYKAFMELRNNATKVAFFKCRRLVQQRLRKMQDPWMISSGKAPGSDAIPPEVYKRGEPRRMAELTTLFQEMWRQGQAHQDFKEVTIVHLYKRKGNRQPCDKYRDISLLNIAGTIFSRILLSCLNGHLEQGLLPESQCGFRRHRGITDLIFDARQLQEKCQEILMLSATLIDNNLEERPGIRIAYRTGGQSQNSRRMQAPTRGSTTKVHDLIFADDCALNTVMEEDMQRSMDLSDAGCANFKINNQYSQNSGLRLPVGLILPPPPPAPITVMNTTCITPTTSVATSDYLPYAASTTTTTTTTMPPVPAKRTRY
ncbi:unnamed protein product [Schistocephalus solidus]|uniref:Reverse transcriptase domain-containing protein n=1 Tax=Schistocephalus solidus TaxID=70667 RepID=A0A183TA93_SCHSO|nr:unnamed protein product [Schistocephalus solidus]